MRRVDRVLRHGPAVRRAWRGRRRAAARVVRDLLAGWRRPRTGAVLAAVAVVACCSAVPVGVSAFGSATATVVHAWRSTESGDRLVRLPSVAFDEQDGSGATTIAVEPAKVYQYIDGFGAALNEAGCSLLDRLGPEARAAVLAAVFDPVDGAGYSMVRIPVGMNDFALSDYTLADADGDFELASFSLERDRALLLPCLRSALAEADLMVLATPWTAPWWMKDNRSYVDGGSVVEPFVDPRYYRAYASYLRRYAEAMDAEGVHVDCISPQNEPGYAAAFGSTLWTAEQMGTFVRDHLGPEFREHRVRTCLRGFEWNRDEWEYADALMSDPEVSRYLAGINFHNYDCGRDEGCDREGLREFRSRHPGTSTWMTEHTDVGGVRDEWANGERWGREILDDIGLGHSGWIFWNLVLDQDGGPWSRDPHTGRDRSGAQQPQIVVDTRTGEVTFLPVFWFEAHLARFVRPGARHVHASGGGPGLDFQAFTDADGSRALVVMNSSDEPQEVRITEWGAAATIALAAHSIHTFTWQHTRD